MKNFNNELIENYLLSFVVLSYNRQDIISENINNLVAMAEKNKLHCEIIVVDNDSKDRTRGLLESETWPHYVRFIYNQENIGVAAGRNVGLVSARGNWVFILDDDSILPEVSLANVLKFIESAGSSVGIIALNVMDMRDGSLVSSQLLDYKKISNFHGAGHVFSRSLIEKIGYLDELCTFGGEELDYSIRAVKSDFEIVFLEDAVVEHYCKARTGLEGKERRYKWIYNYVRVISKHFPFFSAVILSARYFASSVFSGIKDFGLETMFPLLFYASKGFVHGRAYSVVSRKSEGFFMRYADKDMRPEYGNVPLLDKIKNKASHKF